MRGFHAELIDATRAGGRVGEADKVVAKLLHSHFGREERLSLPPLGLLAIRARRIDPDVADVLRFTDKTDGRAPWHAD